MRTSHLLSRQKVAQKRFPTAVILLARPAPIPGYRSDRPSWPDGALATSMSLDPAGLAALGTAKGNFPSLTEEEFDTSIVRFNEGHSRSNCLLRQRRLRPSRHTGYGRLVWRLPAQAVGEKGSRKANCFGKRFLVTSCRHKKSLECLNLHNYRVLMPKHSKTD